ncbi:MAG: tail fiber domain-containing protein [Marmoricola sp.]
MKRNLTVSLLSSVLACVVLLMIAANAGAQGPDGGTSQPIDPAVLNGTPISSTFTYQGQLKSSGSAVSGVCDFQFGLWDTASGGLQVGVTQTLGIVNVANGLFTVPLNFGSNVFKSDARWLAISVRCPAGSGAFMALNPRQALTPAPYALALPGLWTQPGANAPSIIGGYAGNAVSAGADGSVIAGGGSAVYGANIISGIKVGWSTIGGGYNNQIREAAINTVIGGGYANQINGYNTDHSSIGGGWINHIGGGAYDSTIGNGDSNEISGNADHSAIGSGYQNQISGTAQYSAIGSGESNLINGGADHSAIGSGWSNQINGYAYRSAIGSGQSNLISGDATDSAIDSGYYNQISGTAHHSAIGSGQSNLISGAANYSAIGGGYYNQISGGAWGSAIGSGQSNQISGTAYGSAIGGGYQNQIGGSAYESVIGSGELNMISGTAWGSAIGSGQLNVISGTAWGSAIGSGQSNQIGGGAYQSVIGSGQSNLISGTAYGSVIGSGGNNLISGTGYGSVIGSGGNNRISGTAAGSAIGSGSGNRIDGNASGGVIGGGVNNQISGTNTSLSAIGGGIGNTISGTMATIPGGFFNTAAGDQSFAAGTQAKANHQGAFVWGDSTFVNFASTGNNQFLIRANGGVGVGTNAPAAQLHVASSGGDVMPQMRIDQLNTGDAARLRMTVGGNVSQRWDVAATSTYYTFYSGLAGNVLTLTPTDPTDYLVMGNFAHLTAGGAWTNSSDRNVKANFAPVDGRAVLDKVLSLPLSTWNYKAEDAATRHLGPMAQDFYATFGLGSDDKSISTIDPAGVSLAAIQGLYQVVQDKDRRITQLENEVAQLKTDQPFNPFNLISPLLSAVALGGVIVIGLRQKRGGQA